MCDPLTISVAVGAVTALSSAKGQKDAADAQAKQQKLASQLERQRYLQEVTSLRQQQAQEQVALSQRMQDVERQAMEAKAQTVVAAGEGGVAGLSVEALVANVARKQATYAFSERKQAEMMNVNRSIELETAGAGYQRNLFTINKPIPQPNYIGAALQGVQTGMGLYGAAQNAGLTTPKPTEFQTYTATTPTF
jgi:hypothetical protein